MGSKWHKSPHINTLPISLPDEIDLSGDYRMAKIGKGYYSAEFHVKLRWLFDEQAENWIHLVYF